MLKITALENFRTFKKGQYFELDVSQNVNILVGNNGCGKSTLIHAIRGRFGEKASNNFLNEKDFANVAEKFEVKSNYDKCFFYDSIKDDGESKNLCFDAVAYIQGGGYQSNQLSHGQKSMFYLNRVITDIVKFRQNDTESIALLVLDEPDKGFDLKSQFDFYAVLGLLSKKYSIDILVSTHNYFAISAANMIFNVATKEWVHSSVYLDKLIK
jgi:ABC-type Mn2+/Zn2+ transport system ATPase subunit